MNTILNMPFSVIADEVSFILNNLHFIRADWFYAFIPFILYLILLRNKTQSDRNWHAIIDKKLMPFVLTKKDIRARPWPLLLILIAGSLCITALAGPVYKKLPQPVYREQSSLAVLLDLSQSMNAADIKPSRLSRAKLELLDILKSRKTGQTALLVYAADAFIVTPLTDDNATIANLVPALETDMMPAQGSNLSSALAKTVSLFNQSGILNGDILIITDDIRQDDKAAIEKMRAQGYRLSIFGIGTTAGGPIPLQGTTDGGFLQDRKGAIVIPKLQPAKLQQLALSGSGLYTGLQADDSDVNKLTALFQTSEVEKHTNRQNPDADIWQEEGHWLLLPLLIIAALWARKGWISALLPFVILVILPASQPAYAESTATDASNAGNRLLDINHLWSSPDQKAMKAFNAGDHEMAASQFILPEWKASAYYKSGDYESAVRALQDTSHSDGYYNKANALAKLGKYKEAITAYDRALELDENNEDARYNREQVKQALEEQQEQQQQDNQQNDEQQQQGEQDQQQQQNDQAGEPSDEENQDSQHPDPEKSEQPGAPKNEQDQQQAEEQQLKQRDAEEEARREQEEKRQYEQNQTELQPDEVEHDKDSEEKPAEIEINPLEASITEEEKATEQWLKRIPDDPGGLLRRKFLYQYKQQPDQKDDNEPW